MNYKHTFFFLPTITCVFTYSMEKEKKIIEPTEEFKLTRTYGKLKSDFDCLPTDIFETYFKQPLIRTITKQFKHRLLNHQFQTRCDDNFGIYLRVTQNTTFYHHDGTYNIVPNIGMDYANWDESNVNKQVYTINFLLNDKKIESFNLLRMIKAQKSDIKISFSKEECRTGNKQTLFIKKPLMK
jgi:hypothetical protein